MITLTNTNSAEIARTIRRARRGMGTATGLVYTLLVVCTARTYQAALEAAMLAGREHPSRILLIVHRSSKTTKVDAEVHTNENMPGDVVTLFVSGVLIEHADSVVLPLLLPDTPVVAWWPHQSPEEPANNCIGRLAHRRITDAGGVSNSLEAIRVRARHHAPGDTDLTWTRITPWRALLAAALDQYPSRVLGATGEAEKDSAAAELIAAWLESRLDVAVEVTSSAGPGITGVRLHTPAGDIAVLRSDGKLASYEVRGQPKRLVPLQRRALPLLISEELRRMDADDIFEAAAATLLKRETRAKRRASAKRASSTKSSTSQTTKTASKRSSSKASTTSRSSGASKASGR